MPQIEAVNLESLANSSMYVAISFERFGNSRKAKVDITTTAVESRFSHSKRLLNSPELAAITKADNGIKEMVDALCLPSKHEMAGLRMAPNKNVLRIAAILKEYKNITRPALIQNLIDAYPAQLKEAMDELKEHFNPAHFPFVSELADEFSFEYFFVTFGVPKTLADLDPDLLKEESDKQQETFKDAMSSVSNTLLETFAGLVNKLNDGLNGKEVGGKRKAMLPSHFTKLTEFIENFEAMSSFAPEVLRAEVTKMRALMAGIDINKVRESDTLKDELTAKTGEIAAAVAAGAAGNMGGRFFRPAPPKPEPTMAELLIPSDETLEQVSPGITAPKSQAETDMLQAMLKSAESNIGMPIVFAPAEPEVE